MGKSGLEFFNFEIHRASWEIPANLPGQYSLFGQIFLHWAAATLKELAEFQNKKNARPLSTIICKSNFKTQNFNPLITPARTL